MCFGTDSSPLCSTTSTDCKLTQAANEASCSAVFKSGKHTETETAPMTGYTEYLLPITITAGLEKLSGAGGAGATKTSASTTAAPTKTQGGGASDAASSSSTGGVPQITQNAVIMGAAALVGGVMLI